MKKAKPKKGEQPRCRKCGNPARYYGPVGGYSVQCERCNRHQSTLRRAAAARRREAEPNKKPRRVVLGVGHPWFLHSGWSGGRTHICLTRKPGNGEQADVVINFKDLGHYNRIRLVAEVLK